VVLGVVFVENTVTIEEIGKRRENSVKWFANWKFITTGIIIMIAITIAGISYYQATHFNSQIKINGINVGGLTAEKGLEKLQASALDNVVYVGDQQVLDGNDTKMAFTDQDLPSLKKYLKDQWTFFPTSKEKSYSFMPSNQDSFRSETLKKQVEEKLLSLNQSLPVAVDADVRLEQGQIVISNSVSGGQYDVASLLKEYDQHEYIGEIRLEPVYIQPIAEDSEIIKNKQKTFEEFLARTVDYQVQDKVYTLKASELVKNASLSKDLQVKIEDTGDLKNKIAEINNAQSTLNKNFSFKTSSGSVISVPGKGYGWALDAEKETPAIQAAFENGEKSVAAANIHGKGWKGEGYGYDTIANNGIGGTYAEVSIAQQRMWIYKDGQLVLTTNVVTGKHITGHDTHKGVWYILFKKSPSVLTGRENGKITYETPVQYWVPFTNDGQGIHDANWRSSFGGNIYTTNGSHGCVNTPPGVMSTVYNTLSTHDPVIVY
jgi:lipoprotein-anchoring transpeptidase ErfK/SrfK